MHDVIVKALPKEKAHEFCLWAFGEDYEERLYVQLAWRWNARHSDLFAIDYNSSLSEDIKKMIDYWEQETQNGQRVVQPIRRATRKVDKSSKRLSP
jgi:hypothetical protein